MKKLFIILALFSFNVLATPVNVNKADAQTIADSLNGIGKKKAEDIVAYRKKNGDFKTLEDFGKVKGIGEKTLEKNKKDILFEDAAAAGKEMAPAAAPAPAPAEAKEPAPVKAPDAKTPAAAPPAATKEEKKK